VPAITAYAIACDCNSVGFHSNLEEEITFAVSIIILPLLPFMCGNQYMGISGLPIYSRSWRWCLIGNCTNDYHRELPIKEEWRKLFMEWV
jgi:hypothetical protein